ncbi:syntaxin-binding protein 5 [Galendromus occidentalis]|uniref:Syntaxin-binding protein 5 n=1 Tax=Galendromus occidentalis TaxID=34638 RepID=A0AAJ7WIJ5_9ACAR|nr:syntaxin-binding protein 5 [Galendromus occidentalis]
MKRADTKRSGFFKGVLDNLRSSVTQLPSGAKGTASEVQDIPEDKLRKELFNVAKTSRHGFPHNPSAVAYDPIQRLIAIGTHNGSIKILGRPGVEVFFQHVLNSAVVQLQFIVNEGLLLSLCADDSVHQWNIKTQTPEVVHTLKFQKERITYMYLPFQSKWLYLGTEGGNVHLVNVDTFSLSGYVINWNKAIEITRKTKPGAVVHLCENPADPNKLLIAFETGTIVLWDLRSRMAEVRFQHNEPLSSVSWHFEGKQFLASHADGSLTVFNIRNPGKPLSVMYPHLRLLMELNPELSAVPTCLKGFFHPISKVQWWATRAGDNLVLFSGGAPLGVDKNGREMVGASVSNLQRAQLLQMESQVVDFVTAHESPFSSDTTEPYALVTLCKNDLIVVDLLTHPYPNFRLPYSMNIHESPVVCCQYLADCPGDLIPCFYSVGQFFGAKATNMSSTNIKFSEREWPITGGEWGTSIVSYPEIIITGHADGTVRFWDSSTLGFQLLYRFRTSRLFEKLVSDDDPFAVEKLFFDPEGRQLGIAGASYVALFSFAKTENTCNVAVLDTPIHFEMEESSEVSPKSNERVTVRREALTWRAGLQPTLVCQFLSGGTPAGGESARHVTCMAVSSAYNLLAFGNDLGLVVVDTIHNTCVLNFATPELYGSSDPYQRSPRSPKRQDNNGLPDPTESSPDQSTSVSPTTLKPQRHFLDRRSKSMQTPQSGGTGSGTLSASHQQLTTMSSLGAERYPGRKMLQKHPNLASQDEPPQFLLPTAASSSTDCSFSRSRSSSTSSLENVSRESITCLTFCDTFCSKKSDASSPSPSLWVGTSYGSVLPLPLNLANETRSALATPGTGSLFKLKGRVLCIGFVDSNGAQLVSDGGRLRSANGSKTPTGGHFAVLVSEKLARVASLPSQNTIVKTTLNETSVVVCADITQLKQCEVPCLVSYIANGNIMVHSLPSLKFVLEVDFYASPDQRISRTFCFSKNGHGLYMDSRSEIQKFSVSSDFCNQLQDLRGNVHTTKEKPEAPRQSFFKGLFSGGPSVLDRDELFGETGSGKASKTIARHIPGNAANLEAMSQRAGTLAGEVARTRLALDERGQALSQLEERTGRMMSEAEIFASTTNQLVNKYKDKKWYQF